VEDFVFSFLVSTIPAREKPAAPDDRLDMSAVCCLLIDENIFLFFKIQVLTTSMKGWRA